MRRINVTLITCDRCGAESATIGGKSVNKPDEEWLRVHTDSPAVVLQSRDMDFCPACTAIVAEAFGLGEGDSE